MSCPVLQSYYEATVRELSTANQELYTDQVEYVQSIGSRESTVRELSPATTRLRVFYLVNVLCMHYVQETVGFVIRELDMDPEGAQAIVRLAEEGDRSWAGLTKTLKYIESLQEEIEIELGSVQIMNVGRANPLLEGALNKAKVVLERAAKILTVVRSVLHQDVERQTYGTFVTLFVGVEGIIGVPLSERITHLDNLSRITKSSTLIPPPKQDVAMFELSNQKREWQEEQE